MLTDFTDVCDTYLLHGADSFLRS